MPEFDRAPDAIITILRYHGIELCNDIRHGNLRPKFRCLDEPGRFDFFHRIASRRQGTSCDLYGVTDRGVDAAAARIGNQRNSDRPSGRWRRSGQGATRIAWIRHRHHLKGDTKVADAARGLLTGGAVAGPAIASLLATAVLVAVFGPLAVALYRRRT